MTNWEVSRIQKSDCTSVLRCTCPSHHIQSALVQKYVAHHWSRWTPGFMEFRMPVHFRVCTGLDLLLRQS